MTEEGAPSSNVFEAMNEANRVLAVQAREKLIQALKEAVEIYTKSHTREWINEAGCLAIIQKLEQGEPVHVDGPFYGDHLDGVFHDMGINDKDQYSKVKSIIESGEDMKAE